MTELPVELAVSVVIAMVAATVVFVLHRARAPFVVWLAAATVPVIAIWMVGRDHRIHSFHGFFHVAIVKRIGSGGVPPDNPLFAGEPISYAWVFHLVAEALSNVLEVTPSSVFALLNTAALPVCVVALIRVARSIEADRSAVAVGVVLGLFGSGFASDGYLVRVAQETLGWPLEFRGLPPATYFSHVNATAVGLGALSVFLAAVTSLVTQSGRRSTGPLVVFSMIVVAGFVYPFHLPALGVIGLAAVAATTAFGERRAAMPLLASLLGGFAIVSPYVFTLVREKAPEVAATLVLEPGPVGAATVRLLVIFAPAALLLVWDRGAFLGRWRRSPALVSTVALAILATSVPYAIISGPGRTEYKYLTVASLLLGLLAGPSLSRLLSARPRVGWIVLVSFLLPFASDAQFKALHRWEVVDRVIETGSVYRHARGDARALYDWMRMETPAEAVFVDEHLSIPVLGERRLFVGLDRRREQHRGPWPFDGWGMRAETILHWIHGIPAEKIHARSEIARALLDPKAGPARASAIEAVTELVPGAVLYVVARNLDLAEALDADANWSREFDGRAASVFRASPQTLIDSDPRVRRASR